jgi:hypothetical protein
LYSAIPQFFIARWLAKDRSKETASQGEKAP